MRLPLVLVCAVSVLAAACAREDPAPGETGPTGDAVGVEGAAPAQVGALGGPDRTVVAEFERRVEDYMALQEQLESTLEDLSKEATPQQIHAQQRSLAALVAKARADARVGAVFSPEMQAFVRGVVRRVLAGPDRQAQRDAITDENPAGTPIEINGRYPDTVPISTMPPDILAALPPLPDELEYRFVGNHLILLDTRAHIVVDYVEDALPR